MVLPVCCFAKLAHVILFGVALGGVSTVVAVDIDMVMGDEHGACV